MNWRTRCTKYSPTCPLVFTSWMTYRTVLTTGRDENTSCPVGTECTISSHLGQWRRTAASTTVRWRPVELWRRFSESARNRGAMRRSKGYLVIGEQGRWRHASDQWSNGVASHRRHGTVAPCVVT